MSDIRRMPLGHVVDFVIDYNSRQERAEKRAKIEQKRGKRRKASQTDINAWFG